jgi:epoxide hydrolase-like predicted phosphatase
MAIRAIVFDIGGVLEITPPTGWIEKWEGLLGLRSGGLEEKLGDVWRCGSLGTLSLSEVEQRIGEILGIDQAQIAAFMEDLWFDYLGQPNDELIAYFAHLRPRYQTAILSNSFVGARQKEQECYHFGDVCDLLVYSHEEGMEKPEQRFFELVCERLGVQPSEVVFLDDVEGHVLAARRLGIHAIVFQNTAQAIADIESLLQADASEQGVPG